MIILCPCISARTVTCFCTWDHSLPNKIRGFSNSIAGIRRYKYWPEICTPRILLFRSEIQSTDTQIKYKPPIVTTRLNLLSYFVVYIFQSLFTFFNICTQIFTLSRSCRDSISFAYSCFISESLLYYHCVDYAIFETDPL